MTIYAHGIRQNLGQFAQQLLQVFFVGLTIGMQRTVVPVLAESEFGVPADSAVLLMAFVVSFGFVKGAMNFVSGRLSERVGRRRVLIWGWLVALPIPFIFLFGPSWNWIVAANVLLGIKLIAAVGDISHPDWRGSSLGVYRFWRDLGYGIGALLLGLIADATGTLEAGFWFTSAAMALSGLWVAFGMEETLARQNPAVTSKSP